MTQARASYVFSVDLEEARPSAARLADPARLPALTHPYLDYLAVHGDVGTFFVVGEVARAHPELIRRIISDGHEIGCHSDSHVTLDQLDPRQFRDDLLRNLESLHSAGAEIIRGYRAPCFSLVEATRWAYPILAELGFTYSSSVLPARNPISGWAGFGTAPKMVHGVLELPMTLLPQRLLPLPMGGGVYFRVLPMSLLRRAFRRRFDQGEPVLGYLHPYDIDIDQPFAHRGFSRWSPYQWLLRANRHVIFDRLDSVRRLGFSMTTYAEHVRWVRSRLRKDEAPA